MSSSDEDAFPVEREAAMEAIGKMIDSEGLEKLTSSKIRAHLSSVFNKDFDDFRKEVDQLTKETIERREKSKAAPASDNGNKEEKPLKAAASDSGSDTSDEGVVDDSRRVSPKKKATKRKSNDDVGDVDLMTAVKHRRRAAANKAVQILKKTADRSGPRKKDKNAPKKDNSGKFGRMTKLCLLSEDLQSIVGARFMKRCDVVSKMWEYIRAHDLLDPKDKRFFFVDDKLRTVFGCKRFRAFCMAKRLAKHIKEPALLGGEIEQEALAEEARLTAEWKARQAMADGGSGEVSRSTESPQNAAEEAASDGDEESD